MARKKRDYKAEYARRKARSKALGYRNPREEYQSRKALGLSRDFKTIEKQYLPNLQTSSQVQRGRRAAAKAWSDRHSHSNASRYRGNMSNAQFEDYYNTFVADYMTFGPSRRKRAKEKRRRIYQYMVKYGYPVEGGEEGWKSGPPQS